MAKQLNTLAWRASQCTCASGSCITYSLARQNLIGILVETNES